MSRFALRANIALLLVLAIVSGTAFADEVPVDSQVDYGYESGYASEQEEAPAGDGISSEANVETTQDELASKDEAVALDAQSEQTFSVRYRTHVQRVGWQDWKSDGETAGTSGQSLRMEAFRIELSDEAGNHVDGISYQMHVQRIGWQDWASNGELGGTEGQSLRVEAIRVKLSDELAARYDVWYRTHIQTYGWLGWAKNGEASGSAGHSCRMEAVRICVVPKGELPPDYTDGDAFVDGATIVLEGHVQRIGWVSGTSSVGTVGQSLRMEALKASISGTQYEGSVHYSAHVQTYGWQDEVSDGGVAGTSGQSKRIEAMTMRLSGDVSVYYDVWYRLHAQRYGWLGWVSNGQQAGTEGLSLRVESIEVQLLPKGEVPSDYDANATGVITAQDVAAEEAAREAARSGQALADANAAQQALVLAAHSTAPVPSGYCALWVENVYANAGYGTFYGDACDLYDKYCFSSEYSQLKAGMIVAVSTHPHTTAGSIWGHVGVYVGDNTVLDAVYGYVRTSTLTEWVDHYGATVPVRWGWLGNVSVA